MAENRKKVGLALGSGGARGFCHIGVLQVLEENQIPIDFISGCSMGALAAACYACGATIEQMRETSCSVKQSTVMDFSFVKGNGFFKGERAMNVAKKLIGDTLFEHTMIPLRVTAADLSEGKLITFDSGSILPAVRASLSIPVVFKATEDDNDHLLVDGGLIERIPIPAVRELGADIVIAVDALGPVRPAFETKGVKTMPDIIERSYLLLDWESSKHKIQDADILITPEQGNRSLYLFKDNEYSIEQGRLKALEMLPLIKEMVGK